jgi:cation:H+ antiporter
VSEWTYLLAGALLLYFGAEWFVGGASSLALSLRIPRLLIGLTVVAYGTSAPELIVGIEAAQSGHGQVALGNAIGSNIANIGLILGLTALVRPARVDGSLRVREVPMLLASALVVPLLLVDGRVSGWEGAGLVVIGFAYTWWMVRASRSRAAIGQARTDATVTADAATTAGAPERRRARVSTIVTTTLGLAVLLVGGRLFIDGSVQVAHVLGLSERVVGLTVVAVGTSVPELVTSVIAAVKGHSDIAVGNVFGSNIFNVLLCLGSAALAGSIEVDPRAMWFDLSLLVFMTVLAATFVRTERTISRLEGACALAVYIAATSFVVVNG